LAVARAVNRSWLAFLVRRAMRRIGLSDPVLWTYNPLAHEYLDGFSWKHIIYHCVDELAGAPGMPQAVVEEKERELLARSDLVVTSASTLAEAKRPHSRRVEYLANAADFAHFARAANPATAEPDDLQAIPRPRIGFVGAVSDYKVDLEGLTAVFRNRAEWQLVMIGPVGEGQPTTSVRLLDALPNVHLLGSRSYEMLPAYLKGFDVCLLPNRVNRYTRHMFPLKFFEYLASGKPVVMSPLPALADYRHLAYVASPSDTGGFENAVLRALTEPLDADVRAARVAEASRHDWDQQARRLLELVSDLVVGG
jgi:glycosyltransferase involved in cell wall biosynthesis